MSTPMFCEIAAVEPLTRLQAKMYQKLNSCCEKRPYLGRLWVLLVAPADIILEALKTPWLVIRNLGTAILTLVYWVCDSKNYSLKTALHLFKRSACHAATYAVRLHYMPLELIYQMGAILYKPTLVVSYGVDGKTFEPAPARPAYRHPVAVAHPMGQVHHA